MAPSTTVAVAWTPLTSQLQLLDRHPNDNFITAPPRSRKTNPPKPAAPSHDLGHLSGGPKALFGHDDATMFCPPYAARGDPLEDYKGGIRGPLRYGADASPRGGQSSWALTTWNYVFGNYIFSGSGSTSSSGGGGRRRITTRFFPSLLSASSYESLPTSPSETEASGSP